MKIHFLKHLSLLSLFAVIGVSGYAQEHRLTLEQAIELGLQNHQQLKISAAQLQTSSDQVRVAKSQRTPTMDFSANAFYLGDALILDRDWSKVVTEELPHFGNTFGFQASQLLYKGGVINKSIDIAELQYQLAELDLERNEQDIKFLIISNYFDIYKLINQIQILEQNKVLAEQVRDNIMKSYEQDMVTRNEVIRADLQIKNLDQTILTMRNAHAILSNQMSYALGLPDDVLIIPVEDMDSRIRPQGDYIDLAYDRHPALRSAEMNVQIAEKNIAIQKSNWSPAIAAFGGYNMQRPITSRTPALDMYSNSWQAGISLSFNIGNLYRNKRQVNLSRSQARITQEALTYTQQNIEIGVNAAYLKYMEAGQQILLMEESKVLANENYELVRNKYLNQLAITAEMTDASNAKLNAELEYANAVVNAAFQYYNLLKATGSL